MTEDAPIRKSKQHTWQGYPKGEKLLQSGDVWVREILHQLRNNLNPAESIEDRVEKVVLPEGIERFSYENLAKAVNGRKTKGNPLRVLNDAFRMLLEARSAPKYDQSFGAFTVEPAFHVLSSVLEPSLAQDLDKQQIIPFLLPKYPNVATALLDTSTEENAKRIVASLDVRMQTLPAEPAQALPLFEHILHYGNNEQQKLVEQRIRKDIQFGARVIYNFLLSSYPRIRTKTEELCESYFPEVYGVPYTQLRSFWNDYEIERNLKMLEQIEKKRSGGVKLLHDQFGIKEFMRYPLMALIAQIDEIDTDQPYGVVMYSRDDHNDALNAVHDDPLQRLFDQLKGKYGLRIFEVDSNMSAARSLIAADKKYGKTHKIAFAIVSGHGSTSSIQWGSEDNQRLRSEQLQGAGSSRVKEFFVSNPTIVLAACSTGAEDDLSIASALSRQLDATVIAPNADTGINKFNLLEPTDSSTPLLQVDYGKEVTAITYKNGQKVG